jgi:hypothetical protein
MGAAPHDDLHPARTREIDATAESLRPLDTNKDGKRTRDELLGDMGEGRRGGRGRGGFGSGAGGAGPRGG